MVLHRKAATHRPIDWLLTQSNGGLTSLNAGRGRAEPVKSQAVEVINSLTAESPIDRRSLLEAIAVALRVAPSELAEQAFPPAMADPVIGEAQAVTIALEAVLSDLDLGVPTGETARPWPAVAADLNRLNTQLRPATDCATQGAVLPALAESIGARA